MGFLRQVTGMFTRKMGGWNVAKGGGVEVSPSNRDKISSGIHWEEVGNSSGVGLPVTGIQGLCKRDGVRGQGEGALAVMALDSRVMAAEYRAKRYFGSCAGSAVTGIWQSWWGRGRVGRVVLWRWGVRGGRGRSYLGMLGRRRVTPGWADDPVRRQDREDDRGYRI